MSWFKISMASLGVFILLMGTFFVGNMITKPMQLVNKTMETANIIHNYEWFHDMHASWQAKVGQVKSHAALINETTDKNEITKLRIERAGIQQLCRTLVTSYNAASSKINRKIFKGGSLPDELDMASCEV